MHNIGISCTKPSLTGLFSRVHNSDETQLTRLKFYKHLVNNVCKNNFITSYCFGMLSNMLEYTFFGDTWYNPTGRIKSFYAVHSHTPFIHSWIWLFLLHLASEFNHFMASDRSSPYHCIDPSQQDLLWPYVNSQIRPVLLTVSTNGPLCHSEG